MTGWVDGWPESQPWKHDPMCTEHTTNIGEDAAFCVCDTIARVRIQERERIAADIMEKVPCGALCPVMGGAPCTCDYAANLAALYAKAPNV